MSDPSIERFPASIRAGERTMSSVLALAEERFGTLDDVIGERPSTPIERLRHGT